MMVQDVDTYMCIHNNTYTPSIIYVFKVIVFIKKTRTE